MPLMLALTMGIALFVQAATTHPAYPQFLDLSPAYTTRLNQQRAVVLAAAKQRYGTAALTRTKADLPVLQRLIDDSAFKKSQTYQLQCLGIAFGDVLAGELHLHWTMVTDEYGTDPTLRFEHTTATINALTMISKRVEGGEPVNLAQLLSITRQQLSGLQKQLR